MYLTKVPNSADKINFLHQKLSKFFFIEDYRFRGTLFITDIFFENFNFESTLLSKIMSFLTLVRDMKMP